MPLSDNVPNRDLLLSPRHRLLIKGKLFQAAALINGASITQKPVDIIDYHHIELDAPDALLAENAATESFVDVGNQAAFGNVTGHPSLPAVIDADPETETLAPTITSGPDLLAVRQQLLEQALRSGWTRSVDSSLHLEVDGKSLDAAARVGNRTWFTLPDGTSSATLASLAAVCCHIKPEEQDDRLLGVQIVSVAADGRNIQLGNPAFGERFHNCETTDDDEHFRWTNGKASLTFRRHVSVLEVDVGRGAEVLVRAEELNQAVVTIAA